MPSTQIVNSSFVCSHFFQISMFGTIWMALEEWISAATIAFIYGKEADCEHDFLSVNGREYSLQVVCEDGLSAEISKAFSTGIARVLPDVVQALRLRIPVSTLEQACVRLKFLCSILGRFNQAHNTDFVEQSMWNIFKQYSLSAYKFDQTVEP